jgi:predicted nucleotidyltransferase
MEKPLPLEYIRQVVAAYFVDKPVRRVEVFGSYARGEATAESDLDLLVKLTHPVGWHFNRLRAIWRLAAHQKLSQPDCARVFTS